MGAEGGIAKLCRAAIEDCCRQPAPVDVAERSQQAAFAQLVVLEKISATSQKVLGGHKSACKCKVAIDLLSLPKSATNYYKKY